MGEYRFVGEALPRIDTFDKVTGLATFGMDFKLPDMLFGKVLRSGLAHARIIAIDTSKANVVPGVKAVITGKDVPYTYGSIIKDRPFLAVDKVRFAGEFVAAVAAIDESAGEEAMELIKVDYEELPPILDPFEAMKKDSILIHEGINNYSHSPVAFPIKNSNICSYYKLRKGDVETGFRESDFVFENTYKTEMIQHVPMEPHMAIARIDPYSGNITIWSNNVSPYIIRSELAQALGISMSKIRIIVPEVGGSFGSKMYLKLEHVALGLAMKVNNRPVKIALNRDEEFTSSVVRGPSITRIKTGVNKKGVFIAREINTVWDTGGYAECGPMVARNSGHTAAGPYRIQHVKIDGYCVYTNKHIGGAFRGYGVPEVAWAYESHVDEIAKELSIDPVEIRIKNAFVKGDINATGQKLQSVGLKECIMKVVSDIDWSTKETISPGKKRGKGIACIHKATMAPSNSTAIIKMNEDGTVGLLMSTIEQGQGSEMVMAQMVAEEIGIDIKDVIVSPPDTEYTPFDSSTTASRSTFSMGNAIRAAAQDLKWQIAEITSDMFKVKHEDIIIENGWVYVRNREELRVEIQKIIPKYFGFRGGTLIGRGFFKADSMPMDPETSQSEKASPFWMYAAQAAEVEVDLETGNVEIIKIAAAHDVGKAINPSNCSQQIEGGVVMGLGLSLYEEVIIDNKGKTANPNLHDYKIPTSLDLPEISAYVVEAAEEDGPFGAKGLGEPVLAPTPSAIANAIYDAVGARIREIPITQEKVLKAIKRAPQAS